MLSSRRAPWSGSRATRPPRPLPKIFRLTKAARLNEDIFTGATINTPSMLASPTHLDALDWAEGSAGCRRLIARADANAAALGAGSRGPPGSRISCRSRRLRSNTSVCLKIVDPAVAALDDPGRAPW